MAQCEQCIVRQISVLNALGKNELIHLSDCKTSSSISKGEILFDEGEYLKGIYCISEGVCKLTKLSANGKDQIVKLAKRGDLLGIQSVLTDQPVILGAKTLTDVQFCFIPADEIMEFFSQGQDFSRAVLKDICGDLNETHLKLVSMARKSVRERLAEVILNLQSEFGVDEKGFISLVLSREDLANLIGTATESAIRLLHQMETEGLVSLDGKCIRVLDERILEKLALGLETLDDKA